jgi:putative DNA primase/helicase
VLANRGRYIAAVLTIVRGYLAAGCPKPCASFASFDDWSRLIRSPLVWLGRADPVVTTEVARADDPVRNNLRAIVAAWQAIVGIDKPLTAGELKEAACNPANDMSLSKALNAVASPPGRSEIDAVRFGRWLGRNRGRVVDGLKIFDQQDLHAKQVKWWIASP